MDVFLLNISEYYIFRYKAAKKKSNRNSIEFLLKAVILTKLCIGIKKQK